MIVNIDIKLKQAKLMPCSNCHKFYDACKARCCSFVPLERDLLYKNFDKIQRHIKETVEFHNNTLIPITEDGYCTFLQPDLKCAIYEHRPAICVKFGDESHVNMTCPYQTKDGYARSKNSTSYQ